MSDQLNPPKEPSSTRLIVSMAVAGFISGLVIIGIYDITFDTIKANKARELREAVFKVLPGVANLQALRFDNGALNIIASEAADEKTIYGGYSQDGAFIGYAIPNGGPGFQDTIRLLYGYLPDKRQVVGMKILESRETPGLGDKIYKDAEFVANFRQLAIDPKIVAVKKGKKILPNEVDTITGATISAKAVVKIINAAITTWAPRLPKPGVEPGLIKATDNKEDPNSTLK
jgi:electron transport complex protein RnfG